MVPSCLLYLVFVSLFSSVVGLIENLEISHDTRRAFHIDSFGYETNGVFEIVLTEFKLWKEAGRDDVKMPELPNIALVLQRSTSDGGLRIENDGCFHEDQKKDDDFVMMIPYEVVAGNLVEYKQSKQILEPGYHHLYFSNCEKDTQVSFKLRLTEYNVDANGKASYLSAGESSLPTWFFALFALFTVQLVIWFSFLRKQKENIRNIHHLMTVVLVLKVLSLFFEVFKYHSLKSTGIADGWSIAYFIFSFLKGMMMFSVIVLIGTGWSYLKPFLTDRDKQIMLVILVVQFMFNIAALGLEETSPGAAEWLTWRDILHLLDMVCCCIILLPIMWSIRHLREAAEIDGKAALNLIRLKRFRTFYLLVVSYVYFTRIIVFLLNATLPFELTWFGTVISELATLAFYGITGWLFRPQPQNPYLSLDQDDENEKPQTQLSDL